MQTSALITMIKRTAQDWSRSEILDLVAALPVYNYNLKSQDQSIRHIGPVAQEFNPLFGFTEAERYINTLDISGVTLAAVRELVHENRELKNRVEELEKWQAEK